jgi:O-glycosyl hydrolase
MIRKRPPFMKHRSMFLPLVMVAMTLCARVTASATALTIHPAETHQTMEGFGTCLVSWKPAVTVYYDRPEFP